MYLAPQFRRQQEESQRSFFGGQFSAPAEPNTPEFNALKEKRAQLQEQMKTIPRSIRGGTNEFGQMPMPSIDSFGPKYNPTQQETDDLARYKSILSQQKEIDSKIESMSPPGQQLIGQTIDLGNQLPQFLSPPTRPGGMENLSGSLGGQIRPSPYSPPSQMGGGFGGQMGGGIGGLQQFMQFMQMMMQMFQQFNSGGQGGIGGFRSPRSGFGGGSPYGPY